MKVLIKGLIATFLVIWVFLLAFGLAMRADAEDYGVLNLSELSIDYKNFKALNPASYEVMTYPEPPKESIFINLKMDLLHYLYLDPTIESWTTDAQYRGIGLEARLGLRLTEYVDIGIYHHSLHELDRNQQLNIPHFLEQDSLEIKLYLYKTKSREALF